MEGLIWGGVWGSSRNGRDASSGSGRRTTTATVSGAGFGGDSEVELAAAAVVAGSAGRGGCGGGGQDAVGAVANDGRFLLSSVPGFRERSTVSALFSGRTTF